MKLEIPSLDYFKRKIILTKAHHNVQILPPELVPYDFLTDSLQHHTNIPNGFPKTKHWFLKPDLLRFQILIRKLFGFSYAIPLAQGRMAEALLSRLLIRNNCVVPTNMAFPTTQLHQELNGAISVETIVKGAYDINSHFAFKGNVDLEKLEKTIHYYTPRWIPYISLEACVNGIGGQAFSADNIAAVSEVAKRHGIKLFLDACRILENAYQIKSNDPKFKSSSTWDIVKHICSFADGLTMSFTKDFPTPIGGMVAFRSEALYQEAFDFIMAMGDGLSVEAKEKICAALEFAKQDTSYIEKRMALSKKLHDELFLVGIPLIQPAGGHAILIDLNQLLPRLPEQNFPAEAFNLELYSKFGIRGAPHLPSRVQKEMGFHLFRFALPILKCAEQDVQRVIECFKKWYPMRHRIKGLKRVYTPEGLSGEFRAWYHPK